jgi:hypothetical protein
MTTVSPTRRVKISIARLLMGVLAVPYCCNIPVAGSSSSGSAVRPAPRASAAAGVSIEDFRGYSGRIVLLSVLAGSPHNSRIALSAIRDR